MKMNDVMEVFGNRPWWRWGGSERAEFVKALEVEDFANGLWAEATLQLALDWAAFLTEECLVEVMRLAVGHCDFENLEKEVKRRETQRCRT